MDRMGEGGDERAGTLTTEISKNAWGPEEQEQVQDHEHEVPGQACLVVLRK
jgi:hypothetical protein